MKCIDYLLIFIIDLGIMALEFYKIPQLWQLLAVRQNSRKLYLKRGF
ncbi:MAG: hypothetical protein NUV32_09025 [Exilispira sp.]|nr:hypothetical protein [Exilispira sp.]